MAEEDESNLILDLKGLLSSLASFAKAAQSLPSGEAFSFEKSFPEFQSALKSAQEALFGVLGTTVNEIKEADDPVLFDSLEDPLLWEECADTCDALVEQVESFLHSTDAVSPLQQWSQTARATSASQIQQIALSTLNDLPKPQEVFHMEVKNHRRAVFIPQVHADKPHSTVPLDLQLVAGHGFDTRFGELRSGGSSSSSSSSAKDYIAPSEHCPHPYTEEIKSFTYLPEQLEPTGPAPTISKQEKLEARWVGTPEALAALSAQLKTVDMMAVDLEAHSYRSFAGLVCLMQISIRLDGAVHNFLVDTLALHDCVNEHLAAHFSNPALVKIMHGADHDVQWLQRDFGIYIVNLFDTGRAARALQFPSAGYAYLLHKYVLIQADKSHQLADWRQRPLPETMQQYAIQDTHYLLDIYDCLRSELHEHSDVSAEGVLDTSRKVCLIRYTPEPFDPEGFRKLIRNREMTEAQQAALHLLWDWRDQTARDHDESTSYVCTNGQLVRLATAAASGLTVNRLQSLFHPVPPLVLANATALLDLLAPAANTHNDAAASGVPAKATGSSGSRSFFQPTEARQRNIMSPVLGTEALYAQAGWTTPLPKMSEDAMEEEEEEDEEDDEEEADVGNEILQGKRTMRGSVGGDTDPVTVDQAKAASSVLQRDMELQKQSIPTVLGLAKTTSKQEETKEEESKTADAPNPSAPEDVDEFVIPRSIREIYMISNRNRRNKKTGSPVPDHTMDVEELAKAEELLKSKGDAVAGYFDTSSANPAMQNKRARTKSGRESEESVPTTGPTIPSKEEDLAFMKEIGWLNNNEDTASLLTYNPPSGGGAANPFFAGAALAGGPLTNGNGGRPFSKKGASTSSSSSGAAKGRQGRRERPEKKDGRTHAYRKR